MMRAKCIRSLLLSVCLVYFLFGMASAQNDFYVYDNWNPNVNFTTGVAGYIDQFGQIEGLPGAEYLVFTGGPSYGGDHTAYIYRVDTSGDPNMHPDNPDDPGPIATRTFTFVSSYYLGNFYAGHENNFYVDDSGIYYGAAPGWTSYKGCAIFHWDFQWNELGCIVPTAAPAGAQTLAYNPQTDQWWVGLGNRQLYRWNGSSWEYQFTHPNLAGNHHDGMVVITSEDNNALFISDMTSDIIYKYCMDSLGNVIDPPDQPCDQFTYSAGPPVEGMGYGPNNHIWIAGWDSYTIYEIGGGALQCGLSTIPDWCVSRGQDFPTFDLDDYVPDYCDFVWEHEGEINLTVTIDSANAVSVNYPSDWFGNETIIFRAIRLNPPDTSQRSVGFTVCPVPVVLDIPNQFFPFQQFDLDQYLDSLCGVDTNEVSWTVSGMNYFIIEIDSSTHAVSVSHPDSSMEPETILFTATAQSCCIGQEPISDSDTVIFYPFEACTAIPGDANGSGSTNGLDVVFMVNYLKGNGPPPPDSCFCPPHGWINTSSDANGSCSFNGLDVVYLVNYLKGVGPAPVICQDCLVE